MNFVYYDLIFLVIFGITISILLYKNKKNVKREMKIAFLYRAQWGVKFIDYVGKKYTRTLNFLKYVIIGVGYILMAGIIYLMSKTVYLYVKYPELTEAIKAPPLAPVIPYFPKLFGLESFFPPFYFTYFILAIGIVMIVHEFSHGILMRHNKVKIKSTGLVFFGPIPGAFVEQDDKDLVKKSKTNQMSILGAGVFANIIFAIIFFLMWWGFFGLVFVPSGAIFNTYSIGVIELNQFQTIGGVNISDNSNQGIIDLINENNLTNDFILGTNGESLKLTKITTNDGDYFMEIEILKSQLNQETNFVGLYYDLPAIRAGLKGNIIEIEGNEIAGLDDLKMVLQEYNPNDQINLKTQFEEEILSYDLVLGEYPGREGEAILGIGSVPEVKPRIEDQLAFFKSPFTDYKIKNEFGLFVYYGLFWIFLLNLLVAFFNMLPFAILDGGRFFFLTIWGITKNEKIAKFAYKWVGFLILFSFALLMAVWFVRII